MNEWLKATIYVAQFSNSHQKKSNFLAAALMDNLPLSLWALGTQAQPLAVAVLQYDSFLVGQPTVTARHACSSVQHVPESPEKGHVSGKPDPTHLAETLPFGLITRTLMLPLFSIIIIYFQE